jgi:hypothetical protein
MQLVGRQLSNAVSEMPRNTGDEKRLSARNGAKSGSGWPPTAKLVKL